MTKQSHINSELNWGSDIFTKLSWFDLNRVQSAKVMVVGAGALGNEVIKNLALFGVGHIFIVDFDIIEYSNLTRSVLFRMDDVKKGYYKADVAAKRVKEINPDVDAIALKGDICYSIGLGLIKDMDVVISCLDNRWARYILNRLCLRVNTPWVDGGIDGLEGCARVFRHGQNCYACNLGEHATLELANRVSCATIVKRNIESNRASTTPIIASIIGAIQAQEAMKLIHPQKLEQGLLTSLCGKMFYWEGEHLTSKIVGFAAWDDDCVEHELWEKVIAVKFSANNTIKEFIDGLKLLFNARTISIVLNNHSFVDYLTLRDGDDTRFSIKLPDFKVAQYIEQDSILSKYLFSQFYQKEFKVINNNFPYNEMRLIELGIPYNDILKVEIDGKVHILELYSDKEFYRIDKNSNWYE